MLIKSLLPFLSSGIILLLFQLLGKFPVSNENWKIIKRSLTKDSSKILTIRTDTSFQTWVLLTSKAQIIERMLDQDLLILSDGGSADNAHVPHWLSQLRNIALRKKSWRYSLLPRYQLKNVLLWRMGVILGILGLFKKLCKTDQYSSWVITGLFKDSSKREN